MDMEYLGKKQIRVRSWSPKLKEETNKQQKNLGEEEELRPVCEGTEVLGCSNRRFPTPLL
ncbi:unnamed protein product [Prunus armeniaca]|uniref:Uncharacterized protein n=1 Tax=Prunus armeniaca TaxID=36596 RepID=A0A6J5WB51_PRUAR|nr:unnamed protein product [Prunus armeniaca]